MGTQQFLIHAMVTPVVNVLSVFLFCLGTCSRDPQDHSEAHRVTHAAFRSAPADFYRWLAWKPECNGTRANSASGAGAWLAGRTGTMEGSVVTSVQGSAWSRPDGTSTWEPWVWAQRTKTTFPALERWPHMIKCRHSAKFYASFTFFISHNKSLE